MKLTYITLFSSLCAFGMNAQVMSLQSPGGNVKVEADGKSYCIDYNGRPVILDSRLGLELDNKTWERAIALAGRKLDSTKPWMEGLKVDSVSYNTHDETWHPLYGERSAVRDNYNGGTVHMSKTDGSNYRLDVEFRVYDNAVAFRYFFPEHPTAVFHKVVDDLTEYHFPAGVTAWAQRWAQAPVEKLPIGDIDEPVERPLTVQYPDGTWLAITDADVDDWCLTRLQAASAGSDTLKSVMYSPVDVVTYASTPWKVIMIADSPTSLLEGNDVILNLNPGCEIADAEEWVKPGTIMRCTKIDTEAGLRNIDFCAEHKIPYMLFDWLWYLPCTSHDGDATKVVDNLDMKRVVDYGKEKGVGVWLYVNQHALMKQQDELLPLLREWGIVGVKSGFVQYASHRWATWLHDLVRAAADNKLLMNIHDEFRPSGFSRTYPNLLTQEGICGNEEWPDATHNVTLPFTRMLCGAADYTICYFDPRLKNTHAHQLAASIVFYSPLQTILWYDTPDRYHGEPEIEWFENLETTFDDTKVLDGFPGENITIARNKGDRWWVGAMTNNDARTARVDFSFLPEGRKFTARIYSDDSKAATATKVGCTTRTVSSKDAISFKLQPKGGVAIYLTPKK